MPPEEKCRPDTVTPIQNCSCCPWKKAKGHFLTPTSRPLSAPHSHPSRTFTMYSPLQPGSQLPFPSAPTPPPQLHPSCPFSSAQLPPPLTHQPLRAQRGPGLTLQLLCPQPAGLSRAEGAGPSAWPRLRMLTGQMDECEDKQTHHTGGGPDSPSESLHFTTKCGGNNTREGGGGGTRRQ